MNNSIVKCNPFQFINLLDFHSSKKENEHGYLRLRGSIKAEFEESYIQQTLTDLDVEIEEVKPNGKGKRLFNGIVTDFEITVENDYKELMMACKTGSYLMDLEPHTRTFQNSSLTYDDALREVTKNYSDVAYIMTTGNGVTIPHTLIQYNETNWAFAKRLASHFNASLHPEYNRKGINFFFGLPDRTSPVNLDSGKYGIVKKYEEFVFKKEHGVSGISENDAVYFFFDSREVYDIGQLVVFQGKKLYISAIESNLVGQEIIHTYFIKQKNGFMVPKTYCWNIIGTTLAGSVVDIKGDTVEISILEDENKENAGTRWFPYSTPYSTPDGTGWYAMPEIGDSIGLYIPDEDESNAFVKSSTHLESSAGDERVNPDYKSIMNKYGKEVLFKPDALLITNNAGMSIEILDNEGIIISSDKSIIVKSEEAVSVSSATSSIELIAPNSLTLKQGSTVIQLKDNVVLSGAQVHLD